MGLVGRATWSAEASGRALQWCQAPDGTPWLSRASRQGYVCGPKFPDRALWLAKTSMVGCSLVTSLLAGTSGAIEPLKPLPMGGKARGSFWSGGMCRAGGGPMIEESWHRSSRAAVRQLASHWWRCHDSYLLADESPDPCHSFPQIVYK